jgi:hypothetical protein
MGVMRRADGWGGCVRAINKKQKEREKNESKKTQTQHIQLRGGDKKTNKKQS